MPQPDSLRPHIFICYRRDGSAGHAGRLYDRLSAHFGVGRVFRDFDLIPAGEDFARAIEAAVNSCEVLLALIDRNWLTRCDAAGRRLLDEPGDYIRLEIAAALRRNVRVIPVLVQGAGVPNPEDLPPELSELPRRQARVLSEEGWAQDVARLIAEIEDGSAGGESAQAAADGAGTESRRAEAPAPAMQEAVGPAHGRGAGAGPAVARPAASSVPRANDIVFIITGSLLVAIILVAIPVAVWFLLPHAEATDVVRRDSATAAKRLEPYVERAGGLMELEMVGITGGTFEMGTPPNEIGREHLLELPVQPATVASFYMGKYEVTRAQWRAVMGQDVKSSRFQDDDRLPVEGVSLFDAREFCSRLSQMTKREYRLPTEPEWEFAARAGTATPFAFGPSLSSAQANFDGNFPYGGAQPGEFRKRTLPVGSFRDYANDFGLYDMHGNVWEWCESYLYGNEPYVPDARGMVLRGGAWDSPAKSLRSGYRVTLHPASRDDGLTHGFRVVANAH